RLADPDPWRNRFRAAKDGQTLKTLAGDVGIARLPAPTLVLLGNALAEAGDLPAAAKLLRQGQQLYPGDFWINHQLAFHLSDLKPPDREGASRFYTAALALRSKSPGVHLTLGNALKARGNLDGAIKEYEEALRLKTDYPGAHYNLGLALRNKGDV